MVSYLFAGLLVCADEIQPAGIAQLLQGVILFVVVGGDMMLRFIRFGQPEPFLSIVVHDHRGDFEIAVQLFECLHLLEVTKPYLLEVTKPYIEMAYRKVSG